MNTSLILNIIRFITLILAQVLVFNHINFLGYLNPYIYILFIAWYPIHGNKTQFLSIAFFLGFLIDVFSDSLAINAAAALTAAYFRPAILRFSFGVNYEFQSFKINNSSIAQNAAYLFLLILIHHLTLFSLEIFSFSQIGLILKKILFTSTFTLILCLLFGILFSVRKK